MKNFKCEEIMCGGCVARIEKALTAAGIDYQVSLDSKTVTVKDDANVDKAVELLDDLGFSAVEILA